MSNAEQFELKPFNPDDFKKWLDEEARLVRVDGERRAHHQLGLRRPGQSSARYARNAQ